MTLSRAPESCSRNRRRGVHALSAEAVASRSTRREFLTWSAGAAAALSCGAGLNAATGQEVRREDAGGRAGPDLVLTGGRVYTIDDRQPRPAPQTDSTGKLRRAPPRGCLPAAAE